MSTLKHSRITTACVLFLGMCSHWLKHHARTAEACGQLFAVLTQTLLHVYKKKHRCKSMISCNEPRLYIAKAKSSPSVYCSNVSVQQFLCSWLMQQCIPMERTPLKVASLCGKISTPIQYVVPWVHLTQHPNSISISTSVFAQLTVESPILYNGSSFPLKNWPFPWSICTLF